MRNWLTLLWILRSTLVCKLENRGSQLVSHWGQKRRCPCSTTMQKRDSTCNFIIKRISSPSEDGNQAIFQYDPLCCLQLHVNPPPEEETPLGWHCSLQASSLVMVVLCGVTDNHLTILTYIKSYIIDLKWIQCNVSIISQLKLLINLKNHLYIIYFSDRLLKIDSRNFVAIYISRSYT